MHARQCSRILLAVALWTALPATAIGQVSVEVGPLVARYAPVGTFSEHALYSTALPATPGDLRGVAWGAQGRLWLTPRFGVQLLAAAASSRFGGGMTSPGGFVTTPKRAQVVTVTAEALYRPPRTTLPLWLSAGAGVVRHGGEAYAPYGSPRATAGVLGIGVDAHIGPRITAALGVTALFYSLNFTDSIHHLSFNYGPQTDVLAYIGLAWRSRVH